MHLSPNFERAEFWPLLDVVDKKTFANIKDGCVISNSGHFDVEINLTDLKKMSKGKKNMRDFVEAYTLKNGKTIFILSQGRLVNLSAAEGHPASVMDMSFANQALAAAFLLQNKDKLPNKVLVLPEVLDQKIAALKLRSTGARIDTLSKRQKEYLSGWREGTQ